MKKLHDLILSKRIKKSKPPKPESEEIQLYASLDRDGCIESLVVWKGTRILVDGYYRYKYCHEHGIPFDIIEMDFDDEDAAIMWAVKMELASRNLTPFQKCEMVLPLEAGIAAEAKKRQGWRSDINGRRFEDPINTRKVMANMAGVSTGTLRYVKYIFENGDEETLRRARSGELSIYGAYRSLAQRLEPPTETERASVTIKAAQSDLSPIKEAVEELIDRVRDGEASPKTIIGELIRVAEMISSANSQ